MPSSGTGPVELAQLSAFLIVIDVSIESSNQLRHEPHVLNSLLARQSEFCKRLTYLVSLSFNPEIVANPMAPINMRVIFHAKNMGLGGRLVRPDVAAAILAAASGDPAAGGAVPSLGGHAAQYFPYIMTAGLDLQESHLAPEEADLDLEPPAISASDVVDRASLKQFVDGAINHVSNLFEVAGIDAGNKLRSTFRDESGPWRAGPVYLFVMDETGYTIFHGAFPDRFELQVPTQTLRDVVTEELILPQIIAAAIGSETGDFVEYHFDDPNDDSDSAEIPKVAFAREHTFSYHHPLLGPSTATYIIGSGFYRGRAPSGTAGQEPCPLPEGLSENPLSNPSVTAGRAAANPTPENLRELAVAARD